MADIFSMAHFTLVVACGDGMTDRLPGVTMERRVSTDRAMFEGFYTRTMLPSLHDTVKDSIWYWRGWTYQEGVLLSRKLFITPFQAAWHCCEMVR
jgi:hypothetical protein